MHSGSSQARRFETLGHVRQKPRSVHKDASATAPIASGDRVRAMATFNLERGKQGGGDVIDQKLVAALFAIGIIRKTDVVELPLLSSTHGTEYSHVLLWDGHIRTAPCKNITGQMNDGVITLRWSGPKERLPPALVSALPAATVLVEPSE